MKTLQEVFEQWEAIIGLEIHTELTTLNTKMFCGCALAHDAQPNTNVCPVCLGMPGALPVPNKAAIEDIVLAGLATNCDIEKSTMFYRKNYFYPDMSKNFQITQGPKAFCMRGHLDVVIAKRAAAERIDIEKEADGTYCTRVGITRIHMEEDAGKLVHQGGDSGRIAGSSYSLIDYNRCGTPLIELVTEPDLRTPEEARAFMEKLRSIFLTLGISDCSMENGSMRCDGNVSLRRRGETAFGVKTELKNMNSFKNLHDGLAYEICRQAEVLESGGEVYQETRHWEPDRKRTIVMRTKETADDYRLFPEPDLAPYELTDEFIEAVRARLPELPDQKAQRFMADYGMSAGDAGQISVDVERSAFLDETMRVLRETNDAPAAVGQVVANLLNNDVAAYLNASSLTIGNCAITPRHIAELALLLTKEEISSKQGKEVFALMVDTQDLPLKIVAERNMRQVSDAGAIEELVRRVCDANPSQVEQFKSGNTKVVGFLVGQCMKESRGQGNPKMINETIVRLLSE